MHIPKIGSGIVPSMPARTPSDIAGRTVSILSFFSKYLFILCVFGLIGTVILLLGLLISASVCDPPAKDIQVLHGS